MSKRTKTAPPSQFDIFGDWPEPMPFEPVQVVGSIRDSGVEVIVTGDMSRADVVRQVLSGLRKTTGRDCTAIIAHYEEELALLTGNPVFVQAEISDAALVTFNRVAAYGETLSLRDAKHADLVRERAQGGDGWELLCEVGRLQARLYELGGGK